MFALKKENERTTPIRSKHRFQVGDRVITSNCRLGTVVRVDHDELGEYVVVQLDILTGNFAYDPWDLEKV